MLRSFFVTAVRTLTILPIPGKECEAFSQALFWFPLVGLLLGVLQAVIAYALHGLGWYEFSATLVLLSGLILTRGMHADGLADMADGFWGGRTKEARLRIMKDSSIGSFGALALFGVMLLKWVVLCKLIALHLFSSIIAAIMLARWAQVLLASTLPYARSEGGTASAFVQGAGTLHVVVTSAVTLTFLGLIFQADYVRMVLLFITAFVGAMAIRFITLRKIEGVTGDVLGAASELTEVLVWLAAALY